jgi:hypothetical protein
MPFSWQVTEQDGQWRLESTTNSLVDALSGVVHRQNHQLDRSHSVLVDCRSKLDVASSSRAFAAPVLLVSAKNIIVSKKKKERQKLISFLLPGMFGQALPSTFKSKGYHVGGWTKSHCTFFFSFRFLLSS